LRAMPLRLVRSERRDPGQELQSKSFRPPSEGELLFSCVAKRKVTKREGHPAWRLPPILGRQVRELGPGFSTAHPCAGEKESASCRFPLRGLSSPAHRRTGAPGRAAGHPGPHSVRPLRDVGSGTIVAFLDHPTPHALHRLPIRLPRALRSLRASGGKSRGSELPDALQAVRSVMERELRCAGAADSDARAVVVFGGADLGWLGPGMDH
jgi:hypothetical protein